MSPKHAALLLISILALAGCGPSRGKISGTVRYKDQPLSHGQVTFMGNDGVPVTADIKPDGSYEANQVTYGEVLVAVIHRPKDFKSPGELRKEYEAKGETIPPELMRTPEGPLEKYASFETSDLKVTISSSATKHDITLVDN